MICRLPCTHCRLRAHKRTLAPLRCRIALLSRSVQFAFLFLFVSTTFGQTTSDPDNNTPAHPIGGMSATPAEPLEPEDLSSHPRGGPPGVDVALAGTNEPTVAVNPCDRRNIAVVRGGGVVRVSVNGGANWSAPTAGPFPGGYCNCGDGVLAFDDQCRLFFSYLGCVSPPCSGANGIDVFVSELDPTTGAVLNGPFQVTNTGQVSGLGNDKEWLAADRFSSSPYAGRLYVVWTEFGVSTRLLTSFSMDQGANWSAPVQPSVASEGFPWPSHNAVAPNGDVYVAYHATTDSNGGSTGKVIVLRSTSGGSIYSQKTEAFSAGQADVTFNRQDLAGTIPNTAFWLQGSAQAWVLPDPFTPGTVYVVANDDPGTTHGSGDDSRVYIRRSTDSGVNWSTLRWQVDDGAGSTIQVMPTATISDDTGWIAVSWYDNRRNLTNTNGNFLLDLMYTVQVDPRLWFAFPASVRLNDAAFDPDFNAPCREFAQPPNPPFCGTSQQTLRIGEYNGVAVSGGVLHGVWCGNTATGQQIIYDNALPGPDPVYIDGSFVGTEFGTLTQPWNTVIEGVRTVRTTGQIIIASGNYAENVTIDRAMTLVAVGGTVTIGG